MIDPQSGEFTFEDQVWPTICADSGIDPLNGEMRHQLEHEMTLWLKEPTPASVRKTLAGNAKVVKSAAALLAAIEETGADFTFEDERPLSEVLEDVVYGWGKWHREIEAYGSRPSLAQLLCWVWNDLWRKDLACSVHPTTGVPNGPLVRFLIAVSSEVTNDPLSAEQARYAIRSAKA